jgi:hypothetical protein
MKPHHLKFIFFSLFISALLISCQKDASTIQSNKQPAPLGCSATVTALITYNGNLIAGGDFGSVDGVSVNYIAQWNGSTWSPLSSGLGGQVSAFTIYNGNLIVGGNFTSAGGNPTNYIAQWNGSTWQSLGIGLPGSVSALTVYNGNLIAGGSFISQWNGTTWSIIDSGLSVFAMTVFNSKLTIGATVKALNKVLQWDGTIWSALDSGLKGPVFALSIYNGNLVGAGGNFVFAQWNGTLWSPLGSYSYKGQGQPAAFALSEYNGNLIGGGAFYGGSTYYFAEWNGTTMSDPTNSSISYSDGKFPSPPCINAITTYNGNLIIGGFFNSVTNTLSTGYIAQYNGSAWSGL